MRRKTQIIIALTLFILTGMGLGAQAANLSLEAIADGETVPKTEFHRGDVLYLHVVLDDATDVAGTAFTLTYDNSMVNGPATDADGLPVDADGVTSLFPFTYLTDTTFRANSTTEANTIYLAGAEIDTVDSGDGIIGGGKYGAVEVTLFTLKYTVPLDAPIGVQAFTLAQTELFNLAAGYGTDNDGDGVFSPGDTKDTVPILVGAVPNNDPDWANLSLAFPDLTSTLGPLPTLEITIAECLDSDIDGLCDVVETNTGTYVDPTDTGTDPNNPDSDGDGIPDGWEVINGLDPTVSNTGVDTDMDGYLDLVEFQNSTDPNAQDPPYAYPGYDPATDNRGPYQRTYGVPTPLLGAAGSTVNLDVYYETSDSNNTLDGLGLRIHYDSTKLTWTGFSNVLTGGVVGTIQDDTGTDYDNDIATDAFLEVTWSDPANWPNVVLPAMLYTATFDVNGALPDGDASSINFSGSAVEAGYTFVGTPVPFTVAPFNLDIDGNGVDDALSDGLLIIRYLFDLVGDPLIDGAVDTVNGTRTTAPEIEAFLADGVSSLMLDIDGNGSVDALSDGLLIIRYLFDLVGDPLIDGAVDTVNGTRTTAPEIEAYLQSIL